MVARPRSARIAVFQHWLTVRDRRKLHVTVTASRSCFKRKPSFAAVALPISRFPARRRAAKSDVLIFIDFTSFLFWLDLNVDKACLEKIPEGQDCSAREGGLRGRLRRSLTRRAALNRLAIKRRGAQLAVAYGNRTVKKAVFS